jgi:ABC-2 type transport system permease protein
MNQKVKILFASIFFAMVFTQDKICQHLGFGQAKHHGTSPSKSLKAKLNKDDKSNDGDYFINDSLYRWDEQSFDWVTTKKDNDEFKVLLTKMVKADNDLSTPIELDWKVLIDINYRLRYFKKIEMEKQNARIAEVKQYEQARFDSLLTWVNLDTSIAANKSNFEKAVLPEGAERSYHFSYCKTHEASPTAGLCLGQRDLFPVYFQLNMRDLTRQLNTGELVNPMKLLTGNFDLSYVYIFLLPLLIISLFFNLYAGEKEGGTLPLLLAQSSSIDIIFLGKGILRYIIVLGLSTLLLVLGFLIQGVSIVENGGLFSHWFSAIFIYSFFWSLIMAWILALKKGTALSAMLGLGTWLVLTLISPALLNLLVSANKPLPNRTDVSHAVREINDKNWDAPKSYVLDKFHTDNPQFPQGDTTHFYSWYFASFSVMDKELAPLQEAFEAQVNKRNDLLEKWMWVSPAALIHEHLSGISKTDRKSHMKFVESTKDYHEELRVIYLHKLFAKENFTAQDLKKLQAMSRQ